MTDKLTLQVRGLRGIMTVEALPQGTKVTFVAGCNKSQNFTLELSDEEYTACTAQAMDHTWQSRQCAMLKAEWTDLFRATGQVKHKRAAFAKAMSFLAERVLTDSECCRVFKEKLAEVLRSEYYRQKRKASDWARYA